MIDFKPEPAVVDVRDPVRAFVRDVVIPAEPRDVSAHGLDDALRQELQDEARRLGPLDARHARRARRRWLVDHGRKWFITGAEGAAFAICMARAPEGATMPTRCAPERSASSCGDRRRAHYRPRRTTSCVRRG
jgi:hypothetical protein